MDTVFVGNVRTFSDACPPDYEIILDTFWQYILVKCGTYLK